MKNVLKKLAKAKNDIKAMEIKKEGRNSYSKYDYFTPGQIEGMVSKVCGDNGLLTMFSLVHDNQNNLQGHLSIIDTDSSESYEIAMATAMPEIKATNAAQQLGGCMTYTERYLKMSAFGITDSNLDFDNSNGLEKKSSNEDLISANQLSIIENLIQTSSISEKEKEKIESALNDMTEVKAKDCIDYLELNQIDKIDSGGNYTQTDIKKKLSKIS